MEAIQRNLLQNDWITLFFMTGIILLFCMKLYKPKRLLGYSIAFFTQGFIEKKAEENVSFFNYFHLFLFSFSVLTLSLLVYFLVNQNNNVVFFYVLLMVFLYYLAQHSIQFFVINVLGIKDNVTYFLVTKIGYLYNLCLWIFPVLIIYTYGFTNRYFLFFCIVILMLLRFFLILRNNKKLVFNELFYFILYFCTLELAPLLILYKTATI